MSQGQVKDDTDNFRSTAAQSVATVALGMLGANVGLIQGMPTIIIGALRGEELDTPLGLSESEASWFGSLLFIILPFGSLCSSFLQDLLGRRMCLVLINVPMFAAWFMIYFATSPTHLFIAILLMSLAVGFMEAPILSYIGETTQPRLRGILSSFTTVFYNCGLLTESFLGAVVPWRTMVLCSTIGPVLGFVGMCLVPDSPAWLVSKGRIREAEKAFQWLRGWVKPESVSGELGALVNYVKQTQGVQMSDHGAEYTPVPTIEEGHADFKTKSSWRCLLEPEVLVGFRIIILYFIISLLASLMAMRPFFIEILNSLHLPIKSHYVVAICGGLQLLGSVSMAVCMSKLGKRKTTFLSLTLSVICCLSLGTYIVLDMDYPWVPVFFFALSFYSATLGIMVIPWILIMELFPLRVRGLAVGITGAIAYAIMFLITKTYYNLADLLGVSGVCFFYGTVGILGFIYLYYDMPETEGVSLEMIEEKLNQRRSTRLNKGNA